MTRFIGIDPSTKTGVVVLNEFGHVVESKELHLANGIYSTAAELQEYGRKITSIVPADSISCIEGFSFGSKGQGVSTQYGVGFAIRFAMKDAGFKYFEPTPSQVKKYATGKGNTSKDNMVIPIFKHWGFEDNSDNVRDAFVLAHIARSIHLCTVKAKYQQEVVDAILSPSEKKKKGKVV